MWQGLQLRELEMPTAALLGYSVQNSSYHPGDPPQASLKALPLSLTCVSKPWGTPEQIPEDLEVLFTGRGVANSHGSQPPTYKAAFCIHFSVQCKHLRCAP